MQVIVISGTSSGIGLNLAKELTNKGFKVIGLSRKIPANVNFKNYSCDITDYEQVNNICQQIILEYSKVDVLINNAGMGMVGSIENSNPEDILHLFNLNFIAAINLTNQFLPLMRSQKQGKIINISSIGSEMGLPFRGFYSASKSALDRITEALRYEVFPFGIEATTVHLGDIQTRIAENRIRSEVKNEYKKTFETVYKIMNNHVDKGTLTEEVSDFIIKLIHKKSFKPHYYFGKFSQKLSVILKRIIPGKYFEFLIKKYSGI